MAPTFSQRPPSTRYRDVMFGRSKGYEKDRVYDPVAQYVNKGDCDQVTSCCEELGGDDGPGVLAQVRGA